MEKATTKLTFARHTSQVRVGGGKAPCQDCDRQMGYLRRWLTVQFKINRDTAQANGRSTGGGAGYRPSLDLRGGYLKALFNGDRNNKFDYIESHADDDE